MNAKIFPLAIAFTLSVPALTLSMVSASIAAAPNQIEGYFVDSEFGVEVFSENGDFTYRGTDLSTGKSISLKRAKISGTADQRVYTWNNSGTLYRVIWKPQDPDYIMFQVISPNGATMMNRILREDIGCPADSHTR
jgi:hypothetical protein